MNTPKMTIAACMLATVAVLPGCSSFKQARVYGECQNQIGGGGGGSCKVGAEAVWESKKGFLADILSKTILAPDAGSYQLDVSGSTIPYPSNGTMVVTLKNSASGNVVAAQTFQWTRTGSVISASHPDSINNWAYSYAGAADSISYELSQFRSAYGSGLQTIAASSYYESTRGAGFTATFLGGSGCERHPRTGLCME